MAPTDGHLKWPTRLLLIQWVKTGKKKNEIKRGSGGGTMEKCLKMLTNI